MWSDYHRDVEEYGSESKEASSMLSLCIRHTAMIEEVALKTIVSFNQGE